jgi:hypothetical protein
MIKFRFLPELQFKRLLKALILVISFLPAFALSQTTQASFYSESMQRLQGFEKSFSATRNTDDIVGLIMSEVRSAQSSESYYRIPVSDASIDRLQRRITRLDSRQLSRNELTAMVDYIHAQMRESRSSSDARMREKITASTSVRRASFHGSVAEIAEARATGMVLTKDTFSQTFDLTEMRRAPRSAQLKVEQNALSGLQHLRDDLVNAPIRARNGIMPMQQIQELVDFGHLRSVGRVAGGLYQTTSGVKINVVPMRSFDSALGSQQYTEIAKNTIDRLNQPARIRALPVMAGANYLPTQARRLRPMLSAGSSYVLPIAIGVESIAFGLSYYQYSQGLISRDQFIQAGIENGIIVIFTGTGGVLGSGFPVIGTTLGSVIGWLLGQGVVWAVSIGSIPQEELNEIIRLAELSALQEFY